MWRKKVAQSSTLDQAGDWTRDLLVGSQRSYQLCQPRTTIYQPRSQCHPRIEGRGPWRADGTGNEVADLFCPADYSLTVSAVVLISVCAQKLGLWNMASSRVVFGRLSGSLKSVIFSWCLSSVRLAILGNYFMLNRADCELSGVAQSAQPHIWLQWWVFLFAKFLNIIINIQTVQPSRFRRNYPDFAWKSQIPNNMRSG